jgi:hypothetical protein
MSAFGDPPSSGGRPWWPALLSVGLVAGAIIGVIIIRSDDAAAPTEVTTAATTTEPSSVNSSTPATTAEPVTTPAPTTSGPDASGVSALVDEGCITVTAPTGSATGCPSVRPGADDLVPRTFVADLDGPVIVTTGPGGAFADPTATVDDGSFAQACRWDELAPRLPVGGIIEVVVCHEGGVMLATTGPTPGADWPLTHLTLPTPYVPDGADLGGGSEVPGMPGALAFTAPVEGIVTCSLLLVPDRTRWLETCGDIHGFERSTALVQLDAPDPTLYEISVDDTGSIISARPLDAMAPSSGCSIESANDLVRVTQEQQPSSVVMGLGCIEDKAALTTGSMLTQEGTPDGAIWVALRDDGVWGITDTGTGIETQLSFPVVPFEIWSAWPEATMPRYREYWWEPIIVLPAKPTIDALATDVLETLGTLQVDPEFRLNERLVAVAPGELPLIVAQVDFGDDDSVAGAIVHVWLEAEFDDTGPVGWRPSAVLTSDVCARGGSLGRELCL